MGAADPVPGTPPLLTLRAGGRELETLRPVSVRCRYRVNAIPLMELVLATDDGDPGHADDEIGLCQPGSTLRLGIGGGATLYEGLVTRLAWRASSTRSELHLQVRHPLQRLASSQRSQVFEQQTDADIVRTLCSAQQVSLAKIDGLGIRHPQMVQLRSSDWKFVLSRLVANGVWLAVQAAGVSIVEPKLAAKADHKLTWSEAGSKGSGANTSGGAIEVDEVSWSFDVLDLPGEVEVSGWDVKQQKTVSAKAAAVTLGSDALDPARLEALGATPWSWSCGTPFEAGELEALARSRLLQLQLGALTGRFVVSGSNDYWPAQTLELSGFGKHFDGRCLVTGVEHLMVQGAWRTTLEVGLQDAWRDAPASGAQTTAGTFIGVVEALDRDPGGLDRFKVRVPALLQDNKPLWARFSTPFAGEAHGMYLYPAIGDEVCVTFFDDDPRYPVIGNAMFNPRNPPPHTASDKGLRGLVFDAQKKQQLMFDGGTGELTLQSGENRVTLKDGIEIASDKDLALDAQGIGVAAKQKVEVQGKSGVSVKGVKIELDQ